MFFYGRPAPVKEFHHAISWLTPKSKANNNKVWRDPNPSFIKLRVHSFPGNNQPVPVLRMKKAKRIVNKKWLTKTACVACLVNNWVNLLHEPNLSFFRLPVPVALPCEGTRDSVFALLFPPTVLLCAFADFFELIHCDETLMRQLPDGCCSRPRCFIMSCSFKIKRRSSLVRWSIASIRHGSEIVSRSIWSEFQTCLKQEFTCRKISLRSTRKEN